MSIHKTVCLFATVVVSGFLPVVSARTACADQPEGVLRTFGFKTNLNADLETLFDSEDSVGVVVAPPDQSSLSFLDFASNPGVDEIVDGTTWVYRRAKHITTGPDSTLGAFVWLLDEDTPEPPPLGAFARTGPDSCVIQDVFYVRTCSSVCPGGHPGDLIVTDFENAEDIFVVVTAVFTR